MSKYKVGDHLVVKFLGPRIVEVAVKAVTQTRNGVRLQVSFGDETARIYGWRIAQEIV